MALQLVNTCIAIYDLGAYHNLCFLYCKTSVYSQRPSIDGEVFWTRKSHYAMNLQLIADHTRRIRFYHQIGWPGTPVYDHTVFDK